MPVHSTLSSLFTDIANAIRQLDGTESNIKADDFPSRISAIPTTGGSNGTFRLNYFVGNDVSYFDPSDGRLYHMTVPSSGYLDIPIPKNSGGYLTLLLELNSDHGFAYYNYKVYQPVIGGIQRSTAKMSANYGLIYNDNDNGYRFAVLYLNASALIDGDEVTIAS